MPLNMIILVEKAKDDLRLFILMGDQSILKSGPNPKLAANNPGDMIIYLLSKSGIVNSLNKG
jgi:hypothetical protein